MAGFLQYHRTDFSGAVGHDPRKILLCFGADPGTSIFTSLQNCETGHQPWRMDLPSERPPGVNIVNVKPL